MFNFKKIGNMFRDLTSPTGPNLSAGKAVDWAQVLLIVGSFFVMTVSLVVFLMWLVSTRL